MTVLPVTPGSPGEDAAGTTTSSKPLPPSREIVYRFALPAGQVRTFPVHLRPDTLRLIPAPRESYPPWTHLACARCPNCSLAEATHPHCPVAVSLLPVVEAFQESWSCEEVELTVVTPRRTITKRTGLMDGLSGLVGLVMATSGCPILDKLRPLAYTHLPFGGLEETLYRAASAYAFAQVFRQARGLSPDWTFAGLAALYDEIATVNRAFLQRLAAVTPKDAALNAILQLNCYAQYSSGAALRRRLAQFEPFFGAYWPAGSADDPPS